MPLQPDNKFGIAPARLEQLGLEVLAACSVLDHIRTGYPQVTLIVGGHHPTRMPVREFYKFLLLLIAFFLIFKVKRHVKMVGLEPDLA